MVSSGQLSGQLGGNAPNNGTPQPALTPQQKQQMICNTFDNLRVTFKVSAGAGAVVAAGAGVATLVTGGAAAPVAGPIALGAGIWSGSMVGFSLLNTEIGHLAGCNTPWL